MTKAGKHILIILLCIVLASEARSQETQVDHRNFAGVAISQLVLMDFRFSYERRITPSHGVIIQLSYKPVLSNFTDATIINLGPDATGWCYRNTPRWYYGSLGYRYYFNQKKTFYLSPELFYRNMSADQVVYSYGDGSGERNTFELRSMKADVMGMNFLIGKKIRIMFSDGFNMGFDVFTGLTFRYKTILTTTYGSVSSYHAHDESPRPGPIPVTDSPLEEKTSLPQFSFQFGVILFASWK